MQTYKSTCDSWRCLESGVLVPRLVLFNPVLDLEFARRFGERQLEARLGSWALRCCYGEGRLRANSPLHSTRQRLSKSPEKSPEKHRTTRKSSLRAPARVGVHVRPRASTFVLGQLSQPTLILHGTADHLVPIEEVEGFQRGKLAIATASELWEAVRF